uniref:Uncharacterized protein n=1 Tax=Astyanax mexicanus TaxID=7994 RepID=A0A3B1J2G6_ASTMX
ATVLRSFLTVTWRPPDCNLSESFTSTGCTLGVDLRRGRRRFSGNLQLPPLSWRQSERSRTPDEDIICRPTTLPFITPPRIDITPRCTNVGILGQCQYLILHIYGIYLLVMLIIIIYSCIFWLPTICMQTIK